MSTDPISPNASEFLSPITFQFDNPEDFDVNCPLSPTSSVRGVYVRSRPTSMAVSELEAIETLTFPSDFASYGLSPNRIVPFLHAVPLANFLQHPKSQIASMQLNIKFASILALAVALATATPVSQPRGDLDIVDTTLQGVAKRMPQQAHDLNGRTSPATCTGGGCAYN
ncbi:hypothetical protein FB45DRAFT_1030893 [Roridomyces roridus]|uniref:Uncharacterized protein n=1 Tax=Roridomyces roridus TaxID=1738132 RepID=A0AAD7BLN8_9AGAR|nr:hypothetical protein FB45DRAFT_1030893 [Roridomyces roridus]